MDADDLRNSKRLAFSTGWCDGYEWAPARRPQAEGGESISPGRQRYGIARVDDGAHQGGGRLLLKLPPRRLQTTAIAGAYEITIRNGAWKMFSSRGCRAHLVQPRNCGVATHGELLNELNALFLRELRAWRVIDTFVVKWHFKLPDSSAPVQEALEKALHAALVPLVGDPPTVMNLGDHVHECCAHLTILVQILTENGDGDVEVPGRPLVPARPNGEIISAIVGDIVQFPDRMVNPSQIWSQSRG